MGHQERSEPGSKVAVRQHQEDVSGQGGGQAAHE